MNELERKLLNGFQREFPLEPRPFAVLAERLGVTEDEVLAVLRDLRERRILGRVGPVFKPNQVGASTLAALAVPQERLDEVAAVVSAFPEVNHNYAREHRFNLWFVVTGETPAHVQAVLNEIELATGLTPMDLPLESEYHIDLGFAIRWN